MELLLCNSILASCPGGPVNVNGVDLLTEIYAIYMEGHMSVGPTAFAGEAVTGGRKARKYIRILILIVHKEFSWM